MISYSETGDVVILIYEVAIYDVVISPSRPHILSDQGARNSVAPSSRTDLYDDVVDVTSFSALDVVEIQN